jgi:CRISPR system Cascade subunit CasB
VDDHSKKVVLRWWQGMNLPSDQLKSKGILPAPTSHKAQLKRCESADAVMLSEGFRALWLKLPNEINESSNPKLIEAWATIAAALAHVKKDNTLTLAQSAGAKGAGDKSIVSELLRF